LVFSLLLNLGPAGEAQLVPSGTYCITSAVFSVTVPGIILYWIIYLGSGIFIGAQYVVIIYTFTHIGGLEGHKLIIRLSFFVIAYVVFYFPTTSLRIYGSVTGYYPPPTVDMGVAIWGHCYTIANPLLYFWLNQTVQAEFIKRGFNIFCFTRHAEKEKKAQNY